MFKTFLAFIVCFGSSQAFICPKNSSLVNEHAVFAMIAQGNWTILASSNIDDDIEERPFNIPLETTTRIKTKMFFTNSTGLVWQRLRFEFYCGENNQKRTFVEFSKLYGRLQPNKRTVTYLQYCSGTQILVWPSVFISFDRFEPNVVMFYVCNSDFESLVIFVSTYWSKEKVQESVRKFLRNFDSKLLDNKKLTYINTQASSLYCKSFKHVCLLNKDSFEEVERNESEEKLKFPSLRMIGWLLLGATVILIVYSLWKLVIWLKDKIRNRNNAVHHFHREDISASVATIMQDLSVHEIVD
jgi:hypothetical protein